MDLENPDTTFRIDSHLLWETIKMKIRGTAISCSSYILKVTQSIQQEMDMVEIELKILGEEKINGIITRKRQNDKIREKGIPFYNLEKKHFTEKILSKFVVENNQVIQDPKAILTEQKLFYEKLYKSSNPRHEELHNELFLNNDNPFISKPS